MKKYKYLIFDLDDTLLDFKDTEKKALKAIFIKYDVEFNEKSVEDYKKINKKLWKDLEDGLIVKKRVLTERFDQFFSLYGKEVSGEEVEKDYRKELNSGHKKIPYAEELLNSLKNMGYKIYAGTNGLGVTQRQRLKDSNLLQYFDDLFISEELGFEKPNEEFFNKIFNKYDFIKKEETLMIGDSVNADIQGANRVGINSVLFNLNVSQEDREKATYNIFNLNELEILLSGGK